MDIEDIRSMIRASIKTQVSKIIEQRRHPPKNFSEFNLLIREVVEDLDHETSYKIWENISLEMEGVEDSSISREWNDSLTYYVHQTDLTNYSKQIILKHLKR